MTRPPGQIDRRQPVERRHPLNRGLLSWWLPFGGHQGGDTLRDSCRRTNVPLTGSPTWVAGPGEFGAVAFNGSSQYAIVPFTMPAAVSWFGWVRFSNFTGAAIVGNWGSDASLGAFRVDASATAGQLRLNVGADLFGSPATFTATGTTVLATDTWYRIGVTVDTVGFVAKVYLNGLLEVTQSTFGFAILVNRPNIGLGARLDNAGTGLISPADYLSGAVGESRLVGAALTADQAAVDYAQACRDHPDLLRRTSNRKWLVGPGATVVAGADSASVADAAALTATLSGTTAAALADAGSVALANADAGSLADAAFLAATTAAADAATATDAGALAATVVGTDVASAGDSGTLAAAPTGSDLIALAESAGVALPQGDTAAATDAATVAVAVADADALTGTDGSSLVASLTAAESVAVADAGSVSGSSSPVANDPVSLSESWSLAVTLAVAETLSAADAESLTAALTLADTVAAADARTLAASAVAADHGSAADGGGVSTGETADTEPHLFMAL